MAKRGISSSSFSWRPLTSAFKFKWFCKNLIVFSKLLNKSLLNSFLSIKISFVTPLNLAHLTLVLSNIPRDIKRAFVG